MGRMERDELTNFTLHLESLTRSRDKNIAGTNVRFYPASTLRRDIVMRLRDAVGRSSMREIRAAVFPEKTRLFASFPGPPKPHKPPRLDSPENTRTGCLSRHCRSEKSILYISTWYLMEYPDLIPICSERREILNRCNVIQICCI